MANELGQPTAQEIAEKFCTEMLCNALLCEGCPVNEMTKAAQPLRAVDVADWNCKSCTFENHGSWRKCGNCDAPRN